MTFLERIEKNREKNLVFAVFMGAKYPGECLTELKPNQMYVPHAGEIVDIDGLHPFCYDVKWAWLMPVVDKIESLGYSVNISRIKVSINHIGSEEEMFSWVCGNPSKKMEILYETLFQFIEWYNQNKD